MFGYNTMMVHYGQEFRHLQRGLATVVPRPDEGFETIHESAMFLHFEDKDRVEPRSPDAFLKEFFGIQNRGFYTVLVEG